MSRSAHAQSDFKMRELPKCSRCKQEFQLVTAEYETEEKKKVLIEEWECQRCSKYVPFDFLKETNQSEDEKFFHRKAQEIQKYEQRNKNNNSKRTLRNNKQK